jgi:hypothetical protein
MAVAESDRAQRADQKVIAVMAQQRRLLNRLNDVFHYLPGAGAGLYLPGIDKTFDTPVRAVTGRRPPLLTVEACDNGSLMLTGAISRLRDQKLVYAPIFSYDIARPFTPRGGGKTLPANNLVLARRANELLAALVAYGRTVAAGTHEELLPLMLPRPVYENGRVVAEDYSPVLGFETANPAANVQEVALHRANPASKLLTRRGVENPAELSTPELDEVVTEWRANFGVFDPSIAAATAAVLFGDSSVQFDLPLATAAEQAPDDVVQAMRAALPPRLRWEASYADLLAAAKNPASPLRISRLSRLQLFPIETAFDLPTEYDGYVLAPLDWAPPPAGRPIDAVA